MPTFIRRPIEVHAIRFVKADAEARTPGGGIDLDTGVSLGRGTVPALLTRDGLAPVCDGDWIVIYADGQQEVWRPSVFAAMWEEVTG